MDLFIVLYFHFFFQNQALSFDLGSGVELLMWEVLEKKGAPSSNMGKPLRASLTL